MGLRTQDLPAYILVVGVVIFFIYVIIQSRRSNQEEQGKETKRK